MSSTSPQQIVIVAQPKSMAIAFILTLLFGPLGMLYSTIAGGIIMLIIYIPAVICTGGIGLFITQPICIIWGMVAASAHNKKLLAGASQSSAATAQPAPSTSSPAPAVSEETVAAPLSPAPTQPVGSQPTQPAWVVWAVVGGLIAICAVVVLLFLMKPPTQFQPSWVVAMKSLFTRRVGSTFENIQPQMTQQPPTPPEIKESPVPAAQMTQMIVSYQPPDFVIGFTLLDANNKEIARSGRVKLTMSEITHLGVQGVGPFKGENKLYESTFDVNPTHFTWDTTGGSGFPPRRLMCGIRVPANLLSRMPPSHAEGKVTARFYDGQDETKMVGLFSKFFFPSTPPTPK